MSFSRQTWESMTAEQRKEAVNPILTEKPTQRPQPRFQVEQPKPLPPLFLNSKNSIAIYDRDSYKYHMPIYQDNQIGLANLEMHKGTKNHDEDIDSDYEVSTKGKKRQMIYLYDATNRECLTRKFDTKNINATL